MRIDYYRTRNAHARAPRKTKPWYNISCKNTIQLNRNGCAERKQWIKKKKKFDINLNSRDVWCGINSFAILCNEYKVLKISCDTLSPFLLVHLFKRIQIFAFWNLRFRAQFQSLSNSCLTLHHKSDFRLIGVNYFSRANTLIWLQLSMFIYANWCFVSRLINYYDKGQ